jgi:NAD/NADP transhydrogenase alpha subunit
MIITKRIATAAAVTAISLGSVVAPAMASSKHLTKSQCSSAKKAWVKKHPHATRKQKSAYNKTLKAESCKVTVK